MKKLKSSWAKPKSRFVATALSFQMAVAATAISTSTSIPAQASTQSPPSKQSVIESSSQDLFSYRQGFGQAQFQRTLMRLQPEQRKTVDRLMNGLYFIDFGHAAPELFQIFMGQMTIGQAKFPNMYDSPGEPALDAFTRGRNFLANLKGSLTLEKVRLLHSQAMAASTTNLNLLVPGEIRSHFVYGPEFQHGLVQAQIDAINESPYLSFMPATGIHADVPQGVDQARNGDRIRGAILYPRPRDIKMEALNRLRPTNPQLVQRVLDYQKVHGSDYTNRDEQLTRDLTSALLQERIENFEKQSAKLGDLRTKADVDQYVRLVSQLQKDFVSIHPFQDGNGRVSRLLLYYAAERKALPAPRLVYPNEDLFWTREMWADQIREGMISTMKLQQDFIRRLQSQLPLEGSVELFSPELPRTSDGKTMNLQEYEAYLKKRFTKEPELKDQFFADPVGTIRRLETEIETNGRKFGECRNRIHLK